MKFAPAKISRYTVSLKLIFFVQMRKNIYFRQYGKGHPPYPLCNYENIRG